MTTRDGNCTLKYAADLVLLFPRREGAEIKLGRVFDQKRYVDTLLGLRRDVKANGTEDLIIDEGRRVLRSDRCFMPDPMKKTTDAAEYKLNTRYEALVAMSKTISETDDPMEKDSLGRKKIAMMCEILEEEYVVGAGSEEPTTELEYGLMMCKAVVRRLQLACGLSTKMKLSIDSDEIICVLSADKGDLATEADRTNYMLQTHNQPFMPEDLYAQSLSHSSAPTWTQDWCTQNPEVRACANPASSVGALLCAHLPTPPTPPFPAVS
jgi:anoctamin-10